MSGQKHNCKNRLYKVFDFILPHSQIFRTLLLCSVNKTHIKRVENLRVNVRRTLGSKRNIFLLKLCKELFIQHWAL